jgi:hypothetical protein
MSIEHDDYCILVTANSDLGAVLVLMFVELREQQCLCFLYGDVHGDPSLVIGMDHTRTVDAEASEPFLDVGYGFLFWGEHVVDLRGSPVLAILLRIGLRPISVDC